MRFGIPDLPKCGDGCSTHSASGQTSIEKEMNKLPEHGLIHLPLCLLAGLRQTDVSCSVWTELQAKIK